MYHLVRSCGSELVLEKPEKRQALVENIWRQLKEKGEPPSVTLPLVHMSNYNTHTLHSPHVHAHALSAHIPGLTAEVGLYNMLLQVYMQNNHKFPPSEFMEKMREDGVMPNQVSVSGRNSLERKSLMFSLCCVLLSSLLSSPAGRELSCCFFKPTATRETWREPCKFLSTSNLLT